MPVVGSLIQSILLHPSDGACHFVTQNRSKTRRWLDVHKPFRISRSERPDRGCIAAGIRVSARRSGERFWNSIQGIGK
jgi:hypothetical protein